MGRTIGKIEGTSSSNLFVFDEPTGSLDNHFRNLFIDLLLEKFVQKPFTSLFITHDYSIISQIMHKHKDVLKHVDFKELTRIQSGKVTLDYFSPEKYVAWLEQMGTKNNANQRMQSIKASW